MFQDVQVQEEQKDERSLDEILCFINGDGGIITVSYIDYITSFLPFSHSTVVLVNAKKSGYCKGLKNP